MYALIAVMVLVASADLVVKRLLRRRLGTRSLPLGEMGCVQLVESTMFIARDVNRPRVAFIWGLWSCSAAMLAAVVMVVPPTGTFGGLLLGGACVHAIETTRHGRVSDYICLKFWPAFDGADVAITVGAFGLVGAALQTLLIHLI
jgi:hypothetical protein